MAGRRPRQTRDEQAGVSPLKPRRGPEPGNVSGNAVPGSQGGHKFGEGNTASKGNTSTFTHGMYSRRAVEARARQIIAALMEDGLTPEHVRHPMFTLHVGALSRIEAAASLGYEYWMDVLDTEGPAAVFGMKEGVPRALIEVWAGLEQKASRLRADMGLTPAGYAKISRDLGIAASATEDRLAAAAREGHAIAARRLGLVQAADADADDAEPGQPG